MSCAEYEMTIDEAIEAAERLLPGESAPPGQVDPRWRAIIKVGEFLETEPQGVWSFIAKWGVNDNDDLRAAIATCLLEHLLGRYFDAYFSLVEELVKSNSNFADTFARCWKFEEAKRPVNSTRFDELQRRIRRRLK
jgi:hypothetical protein